MLNLALKMQLKPGEAFDVDPKKQVMQMILFTAQSPFPACPEFVLNFQQAGKKFKLPLRLPLAVTKFASGLEIDLNAFKTLWQQHTEETKNAIKSGVTAEIIKEKMLPGLKLGYVDGNESNLILAGQFNYMSASSNTAKSAPILARIITGEEFKIQLHSNSGLVNAAVDSTFHFLIDPPKEF
jgi:hypothetical protein